MEVSKVLLVEDNENLLFVVQERLKSEGYEIRVARDAVEGYLAFLLFKPDLVITDLQLPGENGLELMSRIRKVNDCKVRTIYVSGNLERFHTELEQEKGKPEVRLLAKPFSGSDLMSLVHEHWPW